MRWLPGLLIAVSLAVLGCATCASAEDGASPKLDARALLDLELLADEHFFDHSSGGLDHAKIAEHAQLLDQLGRLDAEAVLDSMKGREK